MVVDGNGHGTLCVFLSDDIFVKHCLDLMWGWNICHCEWFLFLFFLLFFLLFDLLGSRDIIKWHELRHVDIRHLGEV